eukprot:TRINITY_DN12917_c0_g1_i1.p1 TRINITY_DN12917_c0_g1~~TRINITY_DN12917_c0_g1_i1.p1  ORF type:complete len:107 (+),score=2.83 TRINITY_DN12917_c0_g1_i1:141-461(+)
MSAYPVQPNAVTKVNFKLITGITMMFGCGKKNTGLCASQYVGQIPNTVSYYASNGLKQKNSITAAYGTAAVAGDTITMTIDLRPFENTVSFARNNLDMGIAFSGLQ